jgi:hypothetical protein
VWPKEQKCQFQIIDKLFDNILKLYILFLLVFLAFVTQNMMKNYAKLVETFANLWSMAITYQWLFAL